MYRLLSLILPGILILAACGGDSEEVKDSASPAAVATTAATTAATEPATQVAQAATQAATEVATAAATAVVTPEGDISEYTVIEGDNLTTIAARYGLTVDQLRSLNPEVSGDVLWVGQILKVAGELKQLDEATATATAAADATQEPTAAATAAAATNGGMTMGSNESKAGLPPFVPWGNNASAGVTVTASVDGVICTTAVADASGQWFFRLEDGCGNEGATVTFTTSDGRSATSTYKMGEGAMVLFLN
jgi:LysM repeat protein